MIIDNNQTSHTIRVNGGYMANLKAVKERTSKPRLVGAECSPEFLERVHQYCKSLERSESWVIVKALEEYMKIHAAQKS